MPPGTIPVHVGDVLAGKFRVERIIGVGGMGMVVAAFHLDLGELRAIKFLLPSMASNGEAVERFTREAKAAARLRGEHVVRVYDVGRFDDGVPFLVMEYLAGEDLGAQLAQWGQLPVDRAVVYAMQILEALAEAHAAGIVHRDLKPQNLLVTATAQGQPCIKVLDFGISKMQGGGSDEATGLTGTEVAMGSPVYMSPEQMRSARRVDGRADLWSLGVILYELLAGREPFSSDTLAGLYQQILQAQPVPPSQLNPAVPSELDAVILRALAKDREQRFSTAYQFATALLPWAGADGRRSCARMAGWVAEATAPPHAASNGSAAMQDPADMQPTVITTRSRELSGRPPPFHPGAGPMPPDAMGWPSALAASEPGGYPSAPHALPRAAGPIASQPPTGIVAGADAGAWPAAPAPERAANRGVLLVVLAVLVLALIGAVVIAAIVVGESGPARGGARSATSTTSSGAASAVPTARPQSSPP